MASSKPPHACVVIATYHRHNGTTRGFLERSISSVLKQTSDAWDLVVVGDKYEPYDELEAIVDGFRHQIQQKERLNQIILLQNDKPEREFIKDKRKLWCVAGATAMNIGLTYARQHGYTYYFHLDDDDYWNERHIKTILDTYEKFPTCVFCNSKSSYVGSSLPRARHGTALRPNNLLPTPGGMVHSSISFNAQIVPVSYQTTFKEQTMAPSDYLLLKDIAQFIRTHTKYCSIYVPEQTCHHDTEGSSINAS
jgi:glycosyltransferase involved in cell wall biosynthesis